MFKIYQKYIIINYLKKLILITTIFFCLTFILSILEEINFFKDVDTKFYTPYFLTILNIPISLFEIFPFIFLISSQFFLYDLLKKKELFLLKKNGVTNLKIVKIIFLLSVLLGVFNIIIFYNVAAKLKFYYSDIKNQFSNDNKYLAMVTDNGLWIKDEVRDKKYIIKSTLIKENFLFENIINEFDADFKLIRTIQSKKIDINEFNWIIYNPSITINNNTTNSTDPINIYLNFDSQKIYNYFSNISSFDIIGLISLKKDFEKLGYTTDEIKIHLLKISTTPLLYGMLTIFSMVIVFNFSKNKSILFHLVMGILISVIIYYINFIFSSLGQNGKIPVYTSIFFPLLIISILAIIGLVNINEK